MINNVDSDTIDKIQLKLEGRCPVCKEYYSDCDVVACRLPQFNKQLELELFYREDRYNGTDSILGT